MNTVEEEHAMANYLDVSLEEIERKYSILGHNIYQGQIAYIANYLSKKMSREEFNKWRMYDDEDAIKRIESLFEKTEIWKNRENDILPNSGNMRSYVTKREMFKRINNPFVNDIVKQNENVFFPNISTMTPIMKIDNALEQTYDIKKIAGNNKININDYKEILNQICYESYPFINEAADIKAKEEIKQMVEDVRISSVNDVTNETRQGIQNSKDKQMEQEGGKDDRQ